MPSRFSSRFSVGDKVPKKVAESFASFPKVKDFEFYKNGPWVAEMLRRFLKRSLTHEFFSPGFKAIAKTLLAFIERDLQEYARQQTEHATTPNASSAERIASNS